MNANSAFRTAAVLYADETHSVSAKTIHKKIIESILIDKDNTKLEIHELIDSIKSRLDLDFDEGEIESVINNNKKDDFLVEKGNQREWYIQLSAKRFQVLKQKDEKNNITLFISKYCEHVYRGNLDVVAIQEALLKFFYELLNKNIAGFKKIINPDNSVNEITIDPGNFSFDERGVINEFLGWDNIDKNKAIFNLVSYCIESLAF